MHFPSYRDFYPKGLIPMNPMDVAALKNKGCSATHWLIALEGLNENEQSEFYIWNILVYQTDSGGCFDHHEPEYKSEAYRCFHTAYAAAKKLEKKCKADGFLSHIENEQIS